MQFTRRELLKGSIAGAAACGLARLTHAAATAPSNTLIDTHVYFGHWPHKQLASEDPSALAAALRRNNVVKAWTGSFDGLFHKNIDAVNRRLADACFRVEGKMLVPFGAVNPTLPDWEEDVRRCHEEFHMPGIRLHPNYHGYTLEDPRFARLLELAAERDLIVQLVAWMDDERRSLLSPSHAEVDLAPLASAIGRQPALKLVVANGYRRSGNEAIRALLPSKHAYFDIGRAANAKEIARLVQNVSQQRALFGSGAPLHNVESILTNLQRAEINGDIRRSIAQANAAALVRK